MQPLWHLGDASLVKGASVTNILFTTLPDELAGRPICVVALVFDVTVTFNSAGGGAGVPGRRAYNIIKGIRLKSDGREVYSGVNGGDLLNLVHMMTGKLPDRPADLAAAGGAATMQIQIIVPLTDLGIVDRKGRLRDYGEPGQILAHTGALKFSWADDAEFGNAFDTITSADVQVSAMIEILDEGEVPQQLEIDVRDINGSKDFSVAAGTYRYLAIVGSNPDDEFAAGEMTEVNAKVGGSIVLEKTPARTLVAAFNFASRMDPQGRIVAPDDVVTGNAHYLPILFPRIDEPLTAVPEGVVRLNFTGSKTSFRVLTVNLPGMDDNDRKRKLIQMGYNPAQVNKVPPHKRLPKTTRPGLLGHLKMSLRKRWLLPQKWFGIERFGRGRD
ncbi:MAG: hypothetical protein IID31_11180 [Planctomycetes bacterium]|nr:hypothetical protein [Planctomycetota bacterium]